MQPGLGTSAKPILMDRFATQAPNAHPKVINLIRIVNARAQGTSQTKQKSVRNTPDFFLEVPGRVRCLDFSIRLSQNSRLLSPQGLFISLFTPVSQQISLQYLAPSPSA